MPSGTSLVSFSKFITLFSLRDNDARATQGPSSNPITPSSKENPPSGVAAVLVPVSRCPDPVAGIGHPALSWMGN